MTLTSYSDRCRYILFPNPSSEDSPGEKRQLEIIVLPHTKTDVLCEYIFDSRTSQVYNIHQCTERSNGITPSAFIDDECVSHFNMYIGTLIDSIFFIIPILAHAKNKQRLNITLKDAAKHYTRDLMENYDSLEFGPIEKIQDKLDDFYRKLILNTNVTSKVYAICDTTKDSDGNPDINKDKFTMNYDKLVEYISRRVVKAAEISVERSIVFKENTKINQNCNALSSGTAQTLACDLFCACMPNILTEVKKKLKSRFGEISCKPSIELESVDSHKSKSDPNLKRIKNITKKRYKRINSASDNNILDFINLGKHKKYRI